MKHINQMQGEINLLNEEMRRMQGEITTMKNALRDIENVGTKNHKTARDALDYCVAKATRALDSVPSGRGQTMEIKDL